MRYNIIPITPPTIEERDLLNKTIEECAEVIQACTKILDYGFESTNPDKPTITNRQHLEQEVGDAMCLFSLMMDKDVLSEAGVYQAGTHKLDRLHKYSNIEVYK